MDPSPAGSPRSRPFSTSGTRAFTLLELVMVVIILAVLATIILPMYRDYELDSAASAMARNVQSVRTYIRSYHAENGSYPLNIDPNYFEPPLENIWAGGNAKNIWTSTLPLNLYPSEKTFDDADANTMWYNRVNGSFHARVPPQESPAESKALFNRVNQTKITTMAQTK